MSRKLPQLWAKKGAIRVSDVGFGFYIVNFETISDYDRAMFGGPWMVNDHYVVIQEWRPYFRPEETILSTFRVWVRLPGIPFEYFDRKILKLIGDRIGKTVRIDHTTLEGSRGNFARICVEVDLSKPLLSKYRLRRRVRRIEYEGLHTICFNCGCYGHKIENCTMAPEVETTDNQTTNFVNPVFQTATDQEDRPEVEEDFGPWMQVRRNRRKNKPTTTPATGAASTPTREGVAENGNRFSAFADKESADAEADMASPSMQRPLGIDVNVPLVEDLSEGEKENVDPAPNAPDEPMTEAVKPTGTLPIGPSVQSNVQAVEKPVIVSPSTSDGASLGPLTPGLGFNVQNPLFTVPPDSSVPTATPKASAPVPDGSVKKSVAPLKAAKTTRTKTKSNSSGGGSKQKDPAHLGGTKDGVAAMDIQ
ncbi:hypothetical protein LINPERHAP2_LOCUS2764 [Linum perenne]